MTLTNKAISMSVLGLVVISIALLIPSNNPGNNSDTVGGDPKENPKVTCFVGGCSGEVCSDSPDVASNCIYKPEFACYKAATCEVQTSGECGWTKTATLSMCIENATKE